MDAEQLYYLWAVLLTLFNIAAWVATLFSLPGNWLVLGATVLFALFANVPGELGIGWTMVIIVAVLAVVGELIEFAAGAMGAAKVGGSRRSILLSLVGTLLGSIFGAVVSAPVPVIGPIIGALAGGAFGAFAGAYLGEAWLGRSSRESFAVGKGAMIGRLLGTVGKLAIGIVMIVLVTIDAFYNPIAR